MSNQFDCRMQQLKWHFYGQMLSLLLHSFRVLLTTSMTHRWLIDNKSLGWLMNYESSNSSFHLGPVGTNCLQSPNIEWTSTQSDRQSMLSLVLNRPIRVSYFLWRMNWKPTLDICKQSHRESILSRTWIRRDLENQGDPDHDEEIHKIFHRDHP